MAESIENKIIASLSAKNCCLAFSLQYTNRSYPTMQFVVFVPTCFIQVSVIVILKKGSITISLVYISATIYSTVWIAVIVYLAILYNSRHSLPTHAGRYSRFFCLGRCIV